MTTTTSTTYNVLNIIEDEIFVGTYVGTSLHTYVCLFFKVNWAGRKYYGSHHLTKRMVLWINVGNRSNPDNAFKQY